ncbi:HAD family hydrolase [Vibrio harveyi]|uniref:HAD family hydrolase n=1 Tax=Vibrio harveyi TaxID=669 RepID=UPI003CEB328F
MIYFLSDLDDTLLQSKAKCGLPTEECTLRGITKFGEPQGYSTPAQEELLKMCNENGTLIPVTARNLAAFKRVLIDFKSYAAICHGAIVLNPEGEPCEDWLKHIEPEVNLYKDLITELHDELRVLIKDRNCNILMDRVLEEFGVVTCGMFKTDLETSEQLFHVAETLRERLAEREECADFVVHQNGRHISILPPYSSKERAADFIMTKLNVSEKDLTFGLGDSISDWDFMKKCKFSVIPYKSQLANSF